MKIVVSAAIASIVAMSSAQAQLPRLSITAAQPLDASGITLIQDGRSQRRDNDMRRDDDRRRYTAGRRYQQSPPGWNRHGNRRPGDWRRRGCIMVGPIWFCP
jgi:Ni/Co efflux regulator RcnB